MNATKVGRKTNLDGEVALVTGASRGSDAAVAEVAFPPHDEPSGR